MYVLLYQNVEVIGGEYISSSKLVDFMIYRCALPTLVKTCTNSVLDAMYLKALSALLTCNS